MTRYHHQRDVEVALVAEFLRQRGFRQSLRALVQDAPDQFDSTEAIETIHERQLFPGLRKDLENDGDSRMVTVDEDPLLIRIFHDWQEQCARRKLERIQLEHAQEDGNDAIWRLPTQGVPFPQKCQRTLEALHAGGILAMAIIYAPKKIWFSDEDKDEDMDTTINPTNDTIPFLLTASSDKTIKVTDLRSEQVLNMCDLTDADAPHHGPVLVIQPHPLYPDVILTASMDGSHALLRWTEPGMTGSDGIIQTWKDHSKYVVRAEFSSDGRFFATASYDRTVNIYAQEDTSLKYNRIFSHAFGNSVEGLCFLNSQTVVASIRDNNYLHYFLLQNPEQVRMEKYNMNQTGDDFVSFSAIQLSPSPPTERDPEGGRYLLISTNQESGRLILFKSHSSKQVQNIYGVKLDAFSQPRHLWHPSGRYVFVTSDDDSSTWVFEVATGQCIRKLGGAREVEQYSGDGHTGLVRCFCFDPQEGSLVTGSFDKTIRIWK